jgi:hypothetical protein
MERERREEKREKRREEKRREEKRREEKRREEKRREEKRGAVVPREGLWTLESKSVPALDPPAQTSHLS